MFCVNMVNERVLNLASERNQFNLCAMMMSVLYDLVKWFASLRNLTVLQIENGSSGCGNQCYQVVYRSCID